MKEIVGERKIVLARELTKIHEEFIRGDINDIISKVDDLKGEMVILIEKAEKNNSEFDFNNISLEEHYKIYEQQGLDKKEIIKRIAKDRNVKKNEIYKQFLN